MIEQLRALDPTDFEHLIADLFERDDCETTVVGSSGDRGIDVIAIFPDGRKALLQAKRYGAGNKIGSPAVQKTASLRLLEPDVDEVFIITTSSYTEQAIVISAELDVKLLNGDGLVELVHRLDGYDLVERYSGERVAPRRSRTSSTDWSGLFGALKATYRGFRSIFRRF